MVRLPYTGLQAYSGSPPSLVSVIPVLDVTLVTVEWFMASESLLLIANYVVVVEVICRAKACQGNVCTSLLLAESVPLALCIPIDHKPIVYLNRMHACLYLIFCRH